MHWTKVLVPLFLSIASAVPTNEASSECLSHIADYNQQLEAATVALKAYDGGVDKVPALAYAMHSTRQTAKKIQAHLDSTESYSAADSALVRNNTMENSAALTDLLNMAKTKAPLIREAGYWAVARNMIKSFHQQDMDIQDGIIARMSPEDYQGVSECFDQHRDAYDALLAEAA